MRITIDAVTLLLPSAGVKNYVYYWLLSLRAAAAALGDIVSTYPPGSRVSRSLNHLEPAHSSLQTRLLLDLVGFANIRRNPTIELLLFGTDVFHCSQHTANLPRRTPTSATVFDLSCWTMPETHTVANVIATRRYGEKTLKVCDGLIAISAHARCDAIEILRIPPERIRVIYPGVSAPFFHVTPQQVEDVRMKFGLHAPYLLFVGCIEPRKNIPNLIRAYHCLPQSIQREVELVIAGPFGWASEDVRTMLSASGASVRYLGYVPEADLPGLFGGARMLLYPSYYEGFGLPVAQALAAGTPVIASACSCLPEVVGGAGLLVNPDNIEEISNAIERVLSNDDLARDLSAKGKVRAEAFRWSQCASQSLEFFHELAGSRSEFVRN